MIGATEVSAQSAAALKELSSHFPALFSAAATCLGTCLTVVMLMLTAFLATRFTNGCAEMAELPGELTAARHKSRCGSADSCTIHIQRDTAGHHGHILFGKAGSGTVVAGGSALIAGVDAGLILFRVHRSAPSFGMNQYQTHHRPSVFLQCFSGLSPLKLRSNLPGRIPPLPLKLMP